MVRGLVCALDVGVSIAELTGAIAGVVGIKLNGPFEALLVAWPPDNAFNASTAGFLLDCMGVVSLIILLLFASAISEIPVDKGVVTNPALGDMDFSNRTGSGVRTRFLGLKGRSFSKAGSVVEFDKVASDFAAAS